MQDLQDVRADLDTTSRSHSDILNAFEDAKRNRQYLDAERLHQSEAQATLPHSMSYHMLQLMIVAMRH